ncbi:hypothetical protein P5673_015132 [Acropora cervicornis]|uniref:Uncharacterized protein n=1 Tax=Acropora cervicornis TaxID=6130 RepID=A0AAD9V5E5_ACRCE|nr:hypothetical protein P5673_015132 [Acropora cervicornis]
MSSGARHQTSQQEPSSAVALGVLVFNNGIQSMPSKLMPMINVEVQAVMIAGWQRIDGKHISSFSYNSQPAVKKRRRKHGREKSKKQDGFVHKEGVMYSSQSFY